MRPKKLVLVLDPDAESLGITMFSLSIRGFAVVGANTVDQAWQIMEERAKTTRPIEALIYRGVRFTQEITLPFPYFSIDNMGITEIATRLVVAMVRKRGPKPAWKPQNNICNSA